MPPSTKRLRDISPDYCGAKKKNGDPCLHHAGFGTAHPGVGRCKFHGGRRPVVRKAAIKEEAIKFMGAPRDINPLDAILWCIRITAGEIDWLSTEIAKVPEDQWFEHSVLGRQMNILQKTRAEAQDRLVRYSKDAIQLGLAERAVRMAEEFGSVLARFVEGLAAELGLTPEQAERWPMIVRRHLILMESGRRMTADVEDAEWRELPAPAMAGSGN
jgi:hypothetical protein